MATPKKEKFTTEELTELKGIRKQFSDISYKLGQIEMQILTLGQDKIKLVSSFNETIEKEKEIAKKLLDKYGKGQIDIDSGEFISAS